MHADTLSINNNWPLGGIKSPFQGIKSYMNNFPVQPSRIWDVYLGCIKELTHGPIYPQEKIKTR
jgi:uncharacterized protein involved in tellurium resistance